MAEDFTVEVEDGTTKYASKVVAIEVVPGATTWAAHANTTVTVDYTDGADKKGSLEFRGKDVADNKISKDTINGKLVGAETTKDVS